MEGLNKDPSSESAFPTRVSSVPVAESQTAADGSALSQFRSPLLRQMMGNKLVAGSRPTSAANDVTVSNNVISVSGDGVTAVDVAIGPASVSNQQSELVEPASGTQSADVKDEIAICDEPLDPSPRIEEPAAGTNLDEITAESATIKPVPIEVWTEETAVDSASFGQTDSDHDRDDDRDELCTADELLDPSLQPEIDVSMSDKPEQLVVFDSEPGPTLSRSNCDAAGDDDEDELCTADEPLGPSPRSDIDIDMLDKHEKLVIVDSEQDPSSSRSADNATDDKDEIGVEDMPLEPSPRPESDVHGSDKLEERISVIDEDRDIDTTETSGSEVKVDLLVDSSGWNSSENVSDSPSALLNGYSDDDVRM